MLLHAGHGVGRTTCDGLMCCLAWCGGTHRVVPYLYCVDHQLGNGIMSRGSMERTSRRVRTLRAHPFFHVVVLRGGPTREWNATSW